jgi:magnesium-transporting ATPase (P-type)
MLHLVVAHCLTQSVSDGEIVASFLTFLILYNNLVPISLYVSLDMIKVRGSGTLCVARAFSCAAAPRRSRKPS